MSGAELNYSVIGGKGFIGSALTRALISKGIEPFVPDKGDSTLLTRELGLVFYCAGLTADFSTRPFDAIEAHVALIAKLLEHGSFTHLVYLSSTRLYDSSSSSSAKEDDSLIFNPGNARHLYDLSKALGENLCRTVGSGRTVVARLSNVFDLTNDATGFLPTLMREVNKTAMTSIDSDSGSVRDYVFLDDVVKALLSLLEGRFTGIFNVASGENISNASLAELCARNGYKLNFRRTTLVRPGPVCDVTKLQSIGVVPRPTMPILESYLKSKP